LRKKDPKYGSDDCFDKQYALNVLYINVSRECNLSCIHCSADSCVASGTTKIPLKRLLSVIDQAGEMGVRLIKITGGEPFAVEGTLDLLRHIQSLGMKIRIETNGTFVNKDLISFLNRIEAQLVIGFDGLQAVTYGLIRGRPDLFDTVITSIHLLKSAEISFEIITTAMHLNLGEISALADLSMQIGAEKHRTNMAIQSMGRGKNVQRLGLDFAETTNLLDDLDEVGRRYEGRIFATKPSILGPPHVASVAPCGWGVHLCGVNPDGLVSLCGAEVMIAGDLKKASLKEIWENSPVFKQCRSMRPSDLRGVCGNCRNAVTCRGMCRLNAFCFYGDLYAPYPLCQMFFEHGAFPESYLINPLKKSPYTS
jgi:AdoMet-dependent heme synthase